jgi:hypothetical protein
MPKSKGNVQMRLPLYAILAGTLLLLVFVIFLLRLNEPVIRWVELFLSRLLEDSLRSPPNLSMNALPIRVRCRAHRQAQALRRRNTLLSSAGWSNL